MKAYIKDHAEEFGADGIEEVEAEEEKPTAAAAYAAAQKQKKEKQERSPLQGVFDTLSNIPMTKETILAAVILVLVLSNVYTYYAAPRPKRLVAQDETRRLSVDEAVRLLLREKHHGPLQQAEELNKILDDVEQRVVQLRASVAKIVSVHEVD